MKRVHHLFREDYNALCDFGQLGPDDPGIHVDQYPAAAILADVPVCCECVRRETQAAAENRP